jgi:hypothetical protein
MQQMHVNRGLLGWGVFFVVLGVVPLAVRAGAVDPEVVRRAWELWPLILVGIGLGLVLARTRLAILGTLVVAVTFGLMGGALIATGVGSAGGFTSCGFGGGQVGDAFQAQAGDFGGDASVRLEMNCGEVNAVAADGTGWSVSGTSDGGRNPELSGVGDQLVVRAPGRSGVDLAADPWRWQVTLPRAVPVAVDLSVNAGSGSLDLAGMSVPSLSVSVNAGDARTDLSSAGITELFDASVNAGSLTALLPAPVGTMKGSVSVNAGSADLCVPEGVALRFRAGDQALGSTNFQDRGMLRSGNTWSTLGYDAATSRIELDVSVNLGSITLDPEDGCD